MSRVSPSIFCLVETKANPTRTLSFCKLFNMNWDWASVTMTGYSGGIIILWKREIGLVTPILRTKTSILVISSSVSVSWVIFIVYNSQRFLTRTYFGILFLLLRRSTSRGSLLGTSMRFSQQVSI